MTAFVIMTTFIVNGFEIRVERERYQGRTRHVAHGLGTVVPIDDSTFEAIENNGSCEAKEYVYFLLSKNVVERIKNYEYATY